MPDPVAILLLVAAGFMGGLINAIAGGATFFTFPAMMAAGLSPVAANASNTVSLAPASFTAFLAMRRYIPDMRAVLPPFITLGLLGGAFGAWLVLWLGDARFRAAVPWLLLIATVMFAAGPHLVRVANAAKNRGGNSTLALRAFAYLMQAFVGIYGGFFGAGMGMITLASLSLFGFADLRAMNALKNLFVSLCNGVAIIVFVAANAVSWPHALIMMAGAVAGGYAGGRIGNRLPQKIGRAIIITVGTILTTVYFIRT